MTRSRIYLTLIILLLTGLACSAPAIPMDDDTFNTAIAQTVMVGLTEKYVSPTFTPSATITLTPTLTAEMPTFTITPIETITPTFPYTPTASNTPAIPLPILVVTVNTNCRTGPDKAFRVEGSLLKGENATVHGIDPTGQYWYIRNPDPGVEYCWLSGKYAVVSGVISLLPVMTAIPTPTTTPTITPVAGLNVIYSKIEACGSWWVNFELVNNGGIAFKSVLIKVKEAYKGRILSIGSNGFESKVGCNTTSTVVDVLEPGASVIISSPSLNNNPAGKKLVATISVCTELDGNGNCITKTMTFKPK